MATELGDKIQGLAQAGNLATAVVAREHRSKEVGSTSIQTQHANCAVEIMKQVPFIKAPGDLWVAGAQSHEHFLSTGLEHY